MESTRRGFKDLTGQSLDNLASEFDVELVHSRKLNQRHPEDPLNLHKSVIL